MRHKGPHQGSKSNVLIGGSDEGKYQKNLKEIPKFSKRLHEKLKDMQKKTLENITKITRQVFYKFSLVIWQFNVCGRGKQVSPIFLGIH